MVLNHKVRKVGLRVEKPGLSETRKVNQILQIGEKIVFLSKLGRSQAEGTVSMET